MDFWESLTCSRTTDTCISSHTSTYVTYCTFPVVFQRGSSGRLNSHSSIQWWEQVLPSCTWSFIMCNIGLSSNSFWGVFTHDKQDKPSWFGCHRLELSLTFSEHSTVPCTFRILFNLSCCHFCSSMMMPTVLNLFCKMSDDFPGQHSWQDMFETWWDHACLAQLNHLQHLLYYINTYKRVQDSVNI